VSGGPDSVGLLLALASLRSKLELSLVAAHVNHRLRGAASDADQACAAAAAAGLTVPFDCIDLGQSLAHGANLEARARRLRYRALHTLAARHDCAAIATGHTLDDQAETLLLRLLRGSGVGGLAGIRPRRRDGVIRPLIDCRRSDVALAVQAAGLATRVDASNADPRFLRTHVRQRVLPLLGELNPAIALACANLAADARTSAALARRWAAAELDRAATDEPSIEWLMRHPAGERSLLVRACLLRSGVPRRGLSARHHGLVLRLGVGGNGGRRVVLPGGYLVSLQGGRLRLEPPPAD
jgi:tRNA(Ile)-lysidine synthase